MNKFKKNHRLKFITNNSGILLIEVIISAGIAGILMLSLLAMMQLLNQNSSRVSLGVTKNEIVNRIRNNAVLLANMESSIRMTSTLGADGLTPDIGTPNNLVNFNSLKDCLPSLATSGSCNKTSMDDARGFRFYLSNGISEDPAKAMAGEDVYYNLSGMRCDQTKAAIPAECPIMAESWAEPFCSNLSTTCTKAISLTIRYRLAIRPDFTGNLLMAPIEGEIYLPLTKGIQLSRLLSQSDNPITMNSSGIYTVQKYYGFPDQGSQPTGLRFEAILGNPTGLVSMRLQYRAVTGVAAAGLTDTTIPPSLTAQTWQEITDLTTDNWIVQLAGAKSNQIINMGTMNSTATGTIISRNLKIGAADSDTAAEKAKFRWNYNVSNVLTEPTFKSGIYQFRVLATDTNSATIESMNYITVRLVGRPEVLTNVPTQPATTKDRNCIAAQKDIQYFMAVTDDEDLGTQSLKLGATDISIASISGTSGVITIPFDLSQIISGSSQNFGYTLSVQNQFTGAFVNGGTITATQKTLNINLNEKALQVPAISLASNPTKVRINETGTIVATYATGSCCQLNPSVSWGYLPAADPLLSGSSTSAATCNIDTNTNSRICTASVVTTGIKENSNPPDDISATFTFSAGNNACTAGTATTVYNNTAKIPVVKIPGIQFYLPESLWLTLPHEPLAAGDYPIKSFTPVVWVEIDFDPHDEPITVAVYKTVEGTEICQLTFNAGLGLNPVRKSCNIPAGFSGKLSLKRVTANVLNAGEISTDPAFKAKINSSSLKTEHLTCQADIRTKFADYTVGTNMPMLNSPWGFDGSNNQWPENDAGYWNAGSVKTFKCYDQWVANVSAGTVNHTELKYGSCVSGILGSDPDLNVQDSKDLFTYNTSSLKPWWCPVYQNSIGSMSFGSSNTRYSTFIFPDNPYLDFDPVNAPYAFVVWNGGGGPANAVWQYSSGTGAASSTPQKAWTNFTNDVCPSVNLTQVKLWGIKTTGHSTAETVMKATNNIYTGTASGYYSYYFMCSYGRWNPVGKASTNWTN